VSAVPIGLRDDDTSDCIDSADPNRLRDDDVSDCIDSADPNRPAVSSYCISELFLSFFFEDKEGSFPLNNEIIVSTYYCINIIIIIINYTLLLVTFSAIITSTVTIYQ